MAPAIISNSSPDFNQTLGVPKPPPRTLRTLLLCPPSLASHPERLENILVAHDRVHIDIQMLDRLALALVSLPPSTYELILVLTEIEDSPRQPRQLFSPNVLRALSRSLKAGGKIQSQEQALILPDDAIREAIFAGLIVNSHEIIKPQETETQSVPLRLSKVRDPKATTSSLGTGAVPITLNSMKAKSLQHHKPPPGVGFDNGTDNDTDDEFIDENTLLDEEDLRQTIIQPLECRPKPGKRRRACKDCTCGMAQRLEAEDLARRHDADASLAKLKADDLAEVDFTVQGKVGSCGNCALGDAFRCDGCPYIGLPAFKPGEEVQLLNDDIQL